MQLKSGLRSYLLAGLVATGLGAHAASQAHAAVGTPVPNPELLNLEGRKTLLLSNADVNVLVFFRTHQERSLALLKELAQCQLPVVTGKSVAWVGLVPSTSPKEEVAALVSQTRFTAPVLNDQDESVYAALRLAMHPVVVLVGRDNKLASFDAFRSVDFCAVIGARLRYQLHDMSEKDMIDAIDPPKSSQGGQVEVALRYRAMAETMFKNGNLEKALDNVRKSLDKDPGLVSAHVLKGKVLSAQGNCVDASTAFAQALSLEAANTEAKAGLATCQTPR